MSQPIPITLIEEGWEKKLTPPQLAWAKANGFNGSKGQFCLLPAVDGNLGQVLYSPKDQDFWDFANLSTRLPQDYNYEFATPLPESIASLAVFAWLSTAYRFDQYRQEKASSFPTLNWPQQANQALVTQWVSGTTLVRDLINTPANDMGPGELAAQIEFIAANYNATCQVLTGEEELLNHNYPAVYAVGKASSRAPCLVDLQWQGSKKGPKLTLVGKGVCFDSGGLDIKPSSNMLIMKKDMGGAAHALALAEMIMKAELPLQLRLLIPAVENSISANAMRPLDVIKTRKGLTVEVGNTDAEGRLILCDALAAACEEEPDLIIDCATLTGAARAALGTDVPALFCNQDVWAQKLLQAAEITKDPLWRMPLYQPYAQQLKGGTADLSSTGKSSYGGAITAALFLEQFIMPDIPWIHLDMMAWNLSSRPGRPEGGEAMGLRALFHLINNWAHA